ncbi:MAG TPA: hypothetical protein VFJ84_01585 [Candidatus Saccharimonadales bacterium]|nr:hypothetical protein [Candidatus Saccharimonadales bacterium]
MAKAKTKTSVQTYAVTPKTQEIFLTMAVLSVLMQAALIAYWVIRQYPSNHNLSAYLIPLVEGIIAPVVFFLSAYLMHRRGQGGRPLWFNSAIYAAIGLLAADVISQSTIFYQQLYVFNGGYWRSVIYTLAPLGFTYIFYLVFLYRFKP